MRLSSRCFLSRCGNVTDLNKNLKRPLDAFFMPRYGQAMHPVNTARERKSGTIKSGSASAGGVAPGPERC